MAQQKLLAGPLCFGNSVVSLGVGRSLAASVGRVVGGEIETLSQLVVQARQRCIERLQQEARAHRAWGVGGIQLEMLGHGIHLELLASGSALYNADEQTSNEMVTSALDGQELYCLHDAGFAPRQLAMGNIAYSLGVGRGLRGWAQSFSRGEVAEYTKIFDVTRHAAIARLHDDAKRAGARAVLCVQTSIAPLMAVQEMLMVGTACDHPLLDDASSVVSSGMNAVETWSLVQQGLMPVQLVLGVSVVSLGLAASLRTGMQSMVHGELSELTELLLEAREKAVARLHQSANELNADAVLGVKTVINELGGGMVEFLAIGTAVKKKPGARTQSERLLPQAVVQQREMFVHPSGRDIGLAVREAPNVRRPSVSRMRFFGVVMAVLYCVLVLVNAYFKLKAKSH